MIHIHQFSYLFSVLLLGQLSPIHAYAQALVITHTHTARVRIHSSAVFAMLAEDWSRRYCKVSALAIYPGVGDLAEARAQLSHADDFFDGKVDLSPIADRRLI